MLTRHVITGQYTPNKRRLLFSVYSRITKALPGETIHGVRGVNGYNGVGGVSGVSRTQLMVHQAERQVNMSAWLGDDLEDLHGCEPVFGLAAATSHTNS